MLDKERKIGQTYGCSLHELVPTHRRRPVRALRFLPLTFLALLATSDTTTATTIHVPDELPTIQAGIDVASHGDTVLVACGTYYEHDIVMKSGVCLTSETGQADCVTVDAQQQGRVFYCCGVDDLASIVGFSITGGLSGDGGGILCDLSSSPRLANCTFFGNVATGTYVGYGGGMCCYNYSSPTLANCTFSGNQAYWSGGGMCCFDSFPTLTACTFSENQSNNFGGGLECFASSPTLMDCTFSSNQAYGYGGGMSCWYSSSPTLTDCTFSGNESGYGGGMSCWYSSSPTLTNCTFSSNQAHAVGGGMSCSDSSPSFTNCIIAFSQPGRAVYCEDATSSPALTCCDVYGNAGGDWVGCIADQYGVNGNFSEDPLFCGDLNPDEPYTLHSDSPCAPEDNPECGLIGAWGVACGLTAVEPVSWGAIKGMFR